ncbi:MAG: hypothetical protein KatS3mg004_0222 [Bryobacteraceae bacterium]|nr:MAG: hypothetical protein KatS3mg004_0222 [Bryobacteraceae bacterium]
MKLHLVFAFAALCAAAPLVSAQSKIGADIPFAFTVGNNAYPAGAWTFERSASTPNLYTLRDQNSKAVAMVLTTALGEMTNSAPLGWCFTATELSTTLRKSGGRLARAPS